MPVPITPVVMPQENLIPTQLYQNYHRRGILQTPLENQHVVPNALLHEEDLASQEPLEFQYGGNTNIQHPAPRQPH